VEFGLSGRVYCLETVVVGLPGDNIRVLVRIGPTASAAIGGDEFSILRVRETPVVPVLFKGALEEKPQIVGLTGCLPGDVNHAPVWICRGLKGGQIHGSQGPQRNQGEDQERE
jgi:hypothetical protein